MRRILAVGCLAVAILAMGRPASASMGGSGCVFPWTQTYRGWGPAVHYGQTVTVVYQAECNTETIEDGSIQMRASGTATVFAGEAAGGDLLETASFENSATWSDPEHPGELRFWGCSVASADYRWSIAGVYDFAMAATDGRWSLDVSPGSVHYEHAGC